MKTAFYLTCHTLLLAAALTSAASCKSAEKTATKPAAPAVAVAAAPDTLVTAPAYTYATKQDTTIECSAEVDFPRQNNALAKGVKEFIAKEFASLYLPYNNEDPVPTAEYPLFQGSVDQPDALVKHYTDGTKRYFASLQKGMVEEGVEPGWMPHFLSEVKVKKHEETSAYVTYGVSHNTYLGGAHGSYLYTETTLSKRSCRPLAQTVDTTKVMQMQDLLRKGVISYLKEGGVENVETDYKSYLFLPEDGHFPLPAFTPALTKEGVTFVYQQYEIASYAVGLVSFTVPYADIMPYLCDEAKALVVAAQGK